MNISCEWTPEDRLLLTGTIAAQTLQKMHTGQMSSAGMLHALETVCHLQAMPGAFLEAQREQILELCE